MLDNKKELKLEQLKSVNGGVITERTIYCMNLFFEAVSTKYDAWIAINPNCSDEEKYQKVQYFVQEVYDSLNMQEKQCLDEFKTEFPVIWEQTIKTIAGIQ